MIYRLNEKDIKIPDEEIARIMKGLEVSKEEAIEIYLEDEGILENEEQEALCKKAKNSRITATIHAAGDVTKRQKREVKQKDNPTKENLIASIYDFLGLNENIENVKITNKTKLIEFDLDGNHFKLDLIQQRKPKEVK